MCVCACACACVCACVCVCTVGITVHSCAQCVKHWNGIQSGTWLVVSMFYYLHINMLNALCVNGVLYWMYVRNSLFCLLTERGLLYC